MEYIFKKYTYVNIFLDGKELNSIINEKYTDDDFCKLSNSEKEKIIEELANQNKEKINITIKINNQYY